ncbi:MAG TPA: hypothetical protein VFN62_12260 [Acidobacteriaceae bacterium]|nr:hypothetical protein [Acidobacteriaceae bacterium]
MRKLLAASVLALCLSTFSAFAAHVFQTGKLISATTEDTMKKGTSHRHVVLTVQIQGMIYTLRGGSVSPKAKDYTKGLIVGDPVQASVDGEHVILKKPNGKDMKTTILKRERVAGK